MVGLEEAGQTSRRDRGADLGAAPSFLFYSKTSLHRMEEGKKKKSDVRVWQRDKTARRGRAGGSEGGKDD